MTVSIHMISVILQTRLCDLCYLKPDLNLPNLLCSDLKKKSYIIWRLFNRRPPGSFGRTEY